MTWIDDARGGESDRLGLRDSLVFDAAEREAVAPSPLFAGRERRPMRVE